MKDGYYYDENGEKVIQVMWEKCEADPEKAPHGIRARGMKAILKERGLWTKGMKKEDMKQILRDQEDFKKDAEILAIHKKVKEHNKYTEIHKFPPFHCETNPIERAWCYLKRKFRSGQDFEKKSHDQMIALINGYLDELPLKMIRQFISTAILYTYSYQTGLGGVEILKQIKQLKAKRNSHRSIYLSKYDYV